MNDSLIKIAKQYICHGQHLFPLKPDSKLPACEWTKVPPLTLEALDTIPPNNLAVRLQPDQLVIDVDVKKGAQGRDSYEKLCKVIPAIASLGYHTLTASGGIHIYLTLPLSIDPKSLMKRHPDYPGIDFLKEGNYTVLAGSVTNGTQYVARDLRFPFPTAPASLLELLTKLTATDGHVPSLDIESAGWGCLSQSELKEALKPLDPYNYGHGGDGDWLSLAMACHYVTAGTGFEEFNNWCMGDANYLDASESNATRWRSFSNKPRSITAYWLRNELERQGCPYPVLIERLEHALRVKLFQEVTTDPLTLYKERIQGMREASEARAILEQAMADKNLSPIDMKVLQEQLREKFPRILTTAVTNTLLKGNPLDYAPDQWADLMIEQVGGPECIAFYEGCLWIFKPREGRFKSFDTKALVHNITEFIKGHGKTDLTRNTIEEIRYFIEAKTSDPEFFNNTSSEQMFNLQNGELHMSSEGFELRPHNPASRRRNVIPVSWNPASKGQPPVWLEYLDTAIYGDDREISYVKLAIGIAYTLTEGEPWLKRAWYILGPSQTGKSKLIELIGKLTGSYSANSWEYIQKNTFALSNLVGKLANLQGETNSEERVNPAYFKQLIAGDPMKAEMKGQPSFIFQNRAVFWHAANELPAFAKDNIQGVLERITLIRLTNPRRPENRRPTLLNEFVEELDEIFHWAIYHYHREYYRDKCHSALERQSQLEQEEVDILSELTDPTLLWFNARIVITRSPDDFILVQDAWEDFMSYTAENQIMHNIYNLKSFGWALKRCLEGVPGAKYIQSTAIRHGDSISRGRRGVKFAVKTSNLLS